ncbi:hypothetical protein AAFF_G00207300 [Aldrovandia affinis]|uniref:Matrix remodeling-associated protein 8 n=1 Tax=Aldrovandia affinis TaxID=143900 RepID=A0AAD7W663_9TELE|nr:hypothetical protein AAFF_G00207300 [Aldrovandia affinis]
MFLSRLALSLNTISRVPGVLQFSPSAGVAVRWVCPSRSPPTHSRASRYATAPAGNTQPPQRWTTLEPELEEVLVPRKLSVSPLESWLSLRYSFPPLVEVDPQPLEEEGGGPEGGSRLVPPAGEPALEEGEGPAPLSCKNVLEIRRRKMNKHKYKKLMKRTKFLRRKVKHGRRNKKQARFEKDLKKIWTRAGLKNAPQGWTTPKLFLKQQQQRKAKGLAVVAKSSTNMNMETATGIAVRLLLLFQISVAFFFPNVLGDIRKTSVVVEARNISAPAGTRVVLQCHNPRMVWSRDQRKDRQRVVHWDLFRSEPEYSVERIVDMFSAGNQRIYNGFNKGRITLSKTAFSNGNFSLTINDVGTNDRGTYTCNLHHHYCNLQESMKVQLNVTKSPRKQKRFWDGEKTVFVVLQGSTVVLPCVNRRAVWTDQGLEDEAQVAHWDWQPPGVRRNGADRLVNLYASGERREYGPLFLRRKMNVSADAFTRGDFSLTVSDLQPPDRGLYSCHLHHHFCGLHERRVYRVMVGPPLPPPELPSEQPLSMPDNVPNTEVVELPRVINVILPEHRGHFLHQLGYILATLLLLVLIAIAIILLTRRYRTRGMEYDLRKSQRGHMTASDFEMGATGMSKQEELKLDYKNNILKEKAEMSKLQSPKVIDLDKEVDRKAWK